MAVQSASDAAGGAAYSPAAHGIHCTVCADRYSVAAHRSQKPRLSDGTLPASHSPHCTAPRPAYSSGLQSVHAVLRDWPEIFPGAQNLHCMLASVPANDPGVQSMQVVWPGSLANVPGAHALQLVLVKSAVV